MLFRALALFSVLSLVFLATESQSQNSRHNRNCLVIKNINGQYLTVNSRRQDRQRKLVLERAFQEKRSTFRFENQGQDRRGRTIYRIESCDNNEAVSWALNNQLKLKDFNYYAFANDLKGVNEFDTWVLDFQSDNIVQILDAESGGRFNLFSATATDEKGDRLALVYAREWPRTLSREENNKRLWTISDAPNFKGSFERSFGQFNKPSSFGDRPSFFDDKPSFNDFNNRPFDGKPSKPFGGFDDSPVLDAEKVDDHNTDKKPLVDENDKDDDIDHEEHEDHEDHKDHEEDEEHKEEEEEVLAAEFKQKSKPKEPCYILKQRFRGLTYTMVLDTEKTQGGQRRTNVIMEQSSSRSSENAWRFVPESDRTFSSKYKIQNCKTDDILSVSYKQSSKSDNRDGEVFVIDENRISEDDAQVWNIDERKDNKILISDASKPSFYLNVISNSKIPRIRDVVSTKRDDTDSESIVFTFEEFKN